MKKLLLSALLPLFFVGHTATYVKPTYNDCAALGLLTMMCMCRLSDQKYVTNETFNKIFNDRNFIITATALGISTIINLNINAYKQFIAYKESIKNKEADINTTEKAEDEQKQVEQEEITVEPKTVRYYYDRYGEMIGEAAIGITSWVVSGYILDKYMDISLRKIFA